jgi:hypothetical protein
LTAERVAAGRDQLAGIVRAALGGKTWVRRV